MGTGLNSTTCCQIESVALLTKLIGIITPLVLSIVVVVAPRLISYNSQSLDCIVHQINTRSYRTENQGKILSYMGFSEWGKRGKVNKAV